MTTPTSTPGARHSTPQPLQRGGRYPDIYTGSEFAAAPPDKNLAEKLNVSIADLRAMNLPPKWLEIAEHIGVDQWLIVWQILDRDNLEQPGGFDPVRVRIPRFSRLMRYLRNRLIGEMSNDGHAVPDIEREIDRRDLPPVCANSIRYIIKSLSDGE